MSVRPYLRDLKKDAIEISSIPGDWVVAGLESTVAWPKETQIVEFDNMDFIIRSQSKDRMPTIALNAHNYGITRVQAQNKILKLASALTWHYGGQLEIISWAGGSYPTWIGRSNFIYACNFIGSRKLPNLSDENANLALAFFREGLSINNPFYAFLSFYKVLSCIHKDGKVRQKWFAENLSNIKDSRAVDRLDDLRKQDIEVDLYLIKEGRHAIAHAEKEIIVNPDNRIDYQRISKDCPF